MDTIGKALFVLAVGPNLILLGLAIVAGLLWLSWVIFRKKPRRDDDELAPRPKHRGLAVGTGTLLLFGLFVSVVLIAVFVRGDHAFGKALFVLAIGPNVALGAYGLLRCAMWVLGSALSTMTEPTPRHAHPDDAFHHPDPIATPAFEQLFMLIAVGLVMVGLPAAIGAVFYFVLPLIGDGWTN